MSAAERKPARELDAVDLSALEELLRDADGHTGLDEYQQDFCDSMRDRVRQHRPHVRLTEAQERVLKAIRAKVQP